MPNHPSFTMRLIERRRAEIVVLFVLPISFMMHLTKLVKRWLYAPDPGANDNTPGCR